MPPLNEKRLIPSLLDRLIDRQPRQVVEEPGAHLITLKELKKNLERDLNALAQTHRASLAQIPPHLRELRRSCFAFGVPELSSFGATERDAWKLAEELQQIIEQFEPRLQGVQVTLASFDKDRGMISLTIDAYLNVEPAPEKVRFDASLPLHGQCLSVKEYRKDSDGG